jgi:hypothetical protein
MVEIPEAWLLVVNALLRAPVAWQTPAELATALGGDVEKTTDLLCLLNVEGWIDVWDCETGPLVTFSPLAAERLHIHLVEAGPEETLRWAGVGDPTPPPLRARHVSLSGRAAALDLVPDPAPPPDRAAEQAECGMRDVECGASPEHPAPRTPHPAPSKLFRPTILLGLGMTPWPGPPGRAIGLCPACHGVRLQPSMYCLYCDRWGLDHLLPARPAVAARMSSSPPRPAPSPQERAEKERTQSQLERARRKARRKRAHQAKLEEKGLRTRLEAVQAKGVRRPNAPAAPLQEHRGGNASWGSPHVVGPSPDSARAPR